MLAVTDAAAEPAAGAASRRVRRPSGAQVVETLLVLASPVALFFVLRLRAMAPLVMPDPAMHTIYIVDPRDFFARFTSELAATSGTREGARVGFLVPARILYLLFGSVNGFFAFRYVLALVAVIPSYVLLRRLAGPAAGALAIVIVMSSPVLVTAWGTDYPDAAVVSYMTAGLACLAMPCGERRRSAWMAMAGAALTLAVWSNVSSAPLVAATLIVFIGIGVRRARARLPKDALVLAGSAVVVTGALVIASGVLLGPFDYIDPTIKAYTYLNKPSTVRHYHSVNRAWILLRPYLLVPVAAVAVWVATFLPRLRAVATPQLIVGVSCAAQVAIYSYLQLLDNAETLEQHYYSSGLWSAICLVLAVTLTTVAKPLLDHRLTRWLPTALALAIPLVYETDPHPPAFGWLPTGVLIVAAGVVAVVIGRRLLTMFRPAGARTGAAAVLVVILGCSLTLTVAGYEHHAPLTDVVVDPVPAYSTALGGSDGDRVDVYRVSTELPRFVGNSTYPSERLLMWFPIPELYALVPIIGIYHSTYNGLGSSPEALTATDRRLLNSRRPAEILVLNSSNFPLTLRLLAPYKPTLLRSTTLRSGDYVLHAWLISLGVYLRHAES